jgi:8-oxo-dGTP pyrophosphatase MutT (NUDIX family)
MLQEYKIFYDHRVVILATKITKSFEKNEELFYHYQNKEGLTEILDGFARFSHIRTMYILHSDLNELFTLVKSCFTMVEAAGGVVKRNDGKVLAIFRRGKWDLPKGKVDKGETFEQTALREVREECGLTHIEAGKHLIDTYHTYSDYGKMILKQTRWYEMFLTVDEVPIPQAEEDITEIKWFDGQTVSEMIQNTYRSINEIITKTFNL